MTDKLIERLREDATINESWLRMESIGLDDTFHSECRAMLLEREAANQLELQARENDQLRAALRAEVIMAGDGVMTDDECDLCQERWIHNNPESHAEGCLASPPALRDDHE